MIDDFVSDATRRMDKSVEAAAHEFNTVRTGRASAALLDQALVDQLLVTLQDRERVQAVLRRDAPDRRQRIAVVQHPFQDHRHHAVAQLAIDRQAVVPVGVHAYRDVS